MAEHQRDGPAGNAGAHPFRYGSGHLFRSHSGHPPYKPRDKAKVEAGVRFAQFYILGRLRNVTFFSLAECNQAVAEAMERINGATMRRLGVSRRDSRDLFLSTELPAAPYEYAEWKTVRVGKMIAAAINADPAWFWKKQTRS